eukprot:scaffold132226_cov26-Prasinocladus_malaysianus.AAC.1
MGRRPHKLSYVLCKGMSDELTDQCMLIWQTFSAHLFFKERSLIGFICCGQEMLRLLSSCIKASKMITILNGNLGKE